VAAAALSAAPAINDTAISKPMSRAIITRLPGNQL
jgi:hypothetical protein